MTSRIRIIALLVALPLSASAEAMADAPGASPNSAASPSPASSLPPTPSPTPSPAPSPAPSPSLTLTPTPPSYASYHSAPFLLNLHVDLGVEAHGQGNPIVFGIGGAALWRGAVGLALGMYASAGAPVLVPTGRPGLADRVTATAALALRLTPLVWKEGDSWLTRFVTGIGVEVGPALDYFRTSSLLIPGCPIPDAAFKPALHAALQLELPLFGSAASGWVSLRAVGRLTLTTETDLAPAQRSGQATCTAQVVEPGAIGQVLFGLSYYR